MSPLYAEGLMGRVELLIAAHLEINLKIHDSDCSLVKGGTGCHSQMCYSGCDATISLSVESGVEGDQAKRIIEASSLTPVGRAVNVQIRVSSDLKPLHEQGQQYATEIRSGNVVISGSIERAYIDGALLKLMLGDAASVRPAGIWVQPSFNISLRLSNPAFPGKSRMLTVHGVKFKNWSLVIPEDNFVMERAEFLALWIGVDDEN